MLSRLLKRVHTPIFGFLLIFSDLFSILIVLYFRKTKAPFKCTNQFIGDLKPENNRIGRHGSDSWTRLTQKQKSEINYFYNVCIYYYFSILNLY